MRGVLQALPFIVLALAAHVALALGLQGRMGAESSGAGGAALVSIEAAPASYSALTQRWERPPQTPETDPARAAPPDVSPPAATTQASPLQQPKGVTPGPMVPPQAEGALPAAGPVAPPAPEAPQVSAPEAQAASAAPPTAPAPPTPIVEAPVPSQPIAEAPATQLLPDSTPPAPPVDLAEARPEDARPRARPEPSSAAASATPRPRQAARGMGGGPAAGQRADPAPAATLSQAERNAYLASWGGGIRAQIERQKSYPDSLRHARVGGTVTVALEVGRDGRLRTAGLATSSGHAALDRAALDAVRRAGRFATAPAALRAPSYSFTLPISFHP